MKKADYIEEIKKSAKDIDFDESTRRLFEEYVDFEKSSAKKLFNIIKKSNKETFIKITYEQIDYMYVGNVDKERAQNMCHIYVNDNKNTSLKYVYLEFGEPHNETAQTANIPNHQNFVKQIFNIASLFGIKLVKGAPKNPKKFHYLFHLTNGEYYHLSDNNKVAFSYFLVLCFRYLLYNMSIYDKRIIKRKSEQDLKRLINKSDESRKLYENAKKMFNNFDFLYAIMKSVNNKKRIKIFNTCVEKNESYANHREMNDILNYIDTATSFIKYGCPKRIVFLQDIAEKQKETVIGKELYDRLTELYDDKYEIISMMVSLRTEKMQQEMIDFLNTGETNKNKIYSKYIDITW